MADTFTTFYAGLITGTFASPQKLWNAVGSGPGLIIRGIVLGNINTQAGTVGFLKNGTVWASNYWGPTIQVPGSSGQTNGAGGTHLDGCWSFGGTDTFYVWASITGMSIDVSGDQVS